MLCYPSYQLTCNTRFCILSLLFCSVVLSRSCCKKIFVYRHREENKRTSWTRFSYFVVCFVILRLVPSTDYNTPVMAEPGIFITNLPDWLRGWYRSKLQHSAVVQGQSTLRRRLEVRQTNRESQELPWQSSGKPWVLHWVLRYHVNKKCRWKWRMIIAVNLSNIYELFHIYFTSRNVEFCAKSQTPKVIWS